MTVEDPRGTLHRKAAIAIDVGGTKIAAGVVYEDGQVVDRTVMPTPHEGETAETLDVLRKTVDDLHNKHSAVCAVGVGAAGVIEWPSGYIRWAPNNTYRSLPLHDILSEHTGLCVVVENDANAAAAAEARFGSGAGYSHSITLTVGTGIGGGIVLDGQLYRGPTGIGAEVGHILVNPRHGPQCACGATGCLEVMASGNALARDGREAAKADPRGVLATLSGGYGNVTGQTVTEAARQNDPIAIALFDEVGYWLGVGIASLVNVLDPQVVILAGGLGSVGELLLRPTMSTFEHVVFARQHRTLPHLVTARLGPDAGLVGAGTLALDAVDHSGRFPNSLSAAMRTPEITGK